MSRPLRNRNHDTDSDKKVVSPLITHYCLAESPVGPLLLAGCERGLRLVNFPKGSQARQPNQSWRKDATFFAQAIQQLNAYFAGELQVFNLPLLLEGTVFQKSVWAALQDVPFGVLASYGDIAKALGKPGAARAVGGANNANPIPIIIPCHRIIGADKSLTGFGGGLPTKKHLLEHEARYAQLEGRLI